MYTNETTAELAKEVRHANMVQGEIAFVLIVATVICIFAVLKPRGWLLALLHQNFQRVRSWLVWFFFREHRAYCREGDSSRGNGDTVESERVSAE